jgi:hypothetical protein
VSKWFESIDAQVQVWQLRQLLQSTNLQNEENLRYLIARHLEKKQKTDSDKEKIDFLLVQYFAHCAPPGADQNVTLEAVAGVLEPALGERPEKFPEKTALLDEKLRKMSECDSLEALQESGALTEAREVKAAAGEHSFDPAFLVAFTRFNFLARRAFFRAMHLDLHAVRAAVNELERRGVFSVDCRAAGLSDSESLEQVRHLIHQWKTPFRAPYSGSSFQQLIQMRQALNQALSTARSTKEAPATKPAPAAKPAPAPEAPTPQRAEPAAVTAQAPPSAPVSKASPTTPAAARPAPPSVAAPKPPAEPAAQQAVSQEEQTEEDDFLQRCLADIAEQLAAMPARSTPGVSTIHLAGCKLMIATWEAEAFRGTGDLAGTMQKAVAARTILHVCIDRTKKKEATDLGLALDIARRQIEDMRTHVTKAKESNNIDAAVNLAATAKRLLALVDEGEKLHG